MEELPSDTVVEGESCAPMAQLRIRTLSDPFVERASKGVERGRADGYPCDRRGECGVLAVVESGMGGAMIESRCTSHGSSSGSRRIRSHR